MSSAIETYKEIMESLTRTMAIKSIILKTSGDSFTRLILIIMSKE